MRRSGGGPVHVSAGGRPITLLTVGLLVGFCWALFFNAVIGARLGVFYYGLVIPGLAIFEGTKNQYPIYDAIAMGVQVMVFTYLLGRTDAQGRNVIEVWPTRCPRRRCNPRSCPSSPWSCRAPDVRSSVRTAPGRQAGRICDLGTDGAVVPRCAEPTSMKGLGCER